MHAAVGRFPERRRGPLVAAAVGAIVWAACWSLVGCGEEPKPTTPGQTASKPAHAEDRALHNPFPQRIKAPGLSGGVSWLNTSGPLELEKLRGKFVLIDFWTYCCINCMHILPELKELEKTFPNELVVIGVHSAKFDTERDSKNITDAILRYEIRHPVVNDSAHKIWNAYGVNTWPTVLLIDPEGYVVYGLDRRIQGRHALPASCGRRFPGTAKRANWTKRRCTSTWRPTARWTPRCDYPGKILADEAGGGCSLQTAIITGSS